MKMIKSLLIALMTVVTVNSFATVHNVFFATSTNVMCFVGDTIRFKDMTFQPTMVSINTTSGPVVITSPMFTTPDGSGKIIDYVVTGNETAYQMNHSAASSSGTITVNTATGISPATKSDVSIRLFPNPCADELNITSSADEVLNVFSANGQLILTSKIKQGENMIDVISLPFGTYFITIGTKTVRFLKN